MTYTVRVADNFNYMDESRGYVKGEYATWDEAVAVCKEIVDRFLSAHFDSSKDEEQLISGYKMFGEDPYIIGGDCRKKFSAWDYAEQRCKELFKGK